MTSGNQGKNKICGQGEERSSGIFAACAFVRLRGCRARLERKACPSGPA